MRPNKTDHVPYYEYYINLVEENNIIDALTRTKEITSKFIANIPSGKENYYYTEGKWTVKQVINHITDTERILSYRALRFARGDAQLLPSFDENLFAANAVLHQTDLITLNAEFNAIRESTIMLFKQLTDKELLLKGKTQAGEVNVLSIGYMICGHALHHLKIVEERYL